jgi:NAD(P)H-flavin reductase
MIAWESTPQDQSPLGTGRNTLWLLIERRSGFSGSLQSNRTAGKWLVDGPHGGTRCLKQYGKALFVASEIGIAAHLLAIAGVLRGYVEKTGRVRRVLLIC